MKRITVFILMMMLLTSVNARSYEPKYKIISSSYSEEDIQEMYEVKNNLLKDYALWVKGVDDKDQVLADHQSHYNAIYRQGVYYIVLGEGKGKSLEGELRVSYCSSTTQIKKKSLFFDWLF